jgi:type IV secretory pathway TrbF-like protein
VHALPLDPDTWKWQAERIKATTNRDLWVTINDWIERKRDRFRDKAIEVEIQEATLVGAPRPNGAIVYMRWRERARSQGSPGDWRQFNATVTLAKLPPTDEKEVAANPLAIFTIDYSWQQQDTPAVQRRADL